MPTDTMLRRCPVASQLGLVNLITRAGGYARVAAHLNLSRSISLRRTARRAELDRLANLLRTTCQTHDLPPPEQSFPSRDTLKTVDPTLANRIAALTGYRGHADLAAHMCNPSNPPMPPRRNPPRRARGIPLTNIHQLVDMLEPYQTHPRVIPKLSALPQRLMGAIQRQGGVRAFATRANLVREKELFNVTRFAKLVRFLADHDGMVSEQKERYFEAVIKQSISPPPFPLSPPIEIAGFTADVARYGGRRYLALRLGFAKFDGLDGLFMGQFSPWLAADVLEFAVREVVPAKDGALAIPSFAHFLEHGEDHLVDAIESFGGLSEVGRRVGLIPLEISEGKLSEPVIVQRKYEM